MPLVEITPQDKASLKPGDLLYPVHPACLDRRPWRVVGINPSQNVPWLAEVVAERDGARHGFSMRTLEHIFALEKMA